MATIPSLEGRVLILISEEFMGRIKASAARNGMELVRPLASSESVQV